MPSKLKVVVTRKLPSLVETRLKELFDTTLNETDVHFSANDLRTALSTADVLVPTLNDKISKELLSEAGPSLKLIANYGSGTDHIDINAATQLGIRVSNSPATSSEDAADMTIALLLAVMRRLKEGSNMIQSGKWLGWSPSEFLGARVTGKKLGILGMGRVGSALADRAKVFGMDIHYHNRKPVHPDKEARLGATYHKTLEMMLREIDVLVTACPLSHETRNIINADRLALLKRGAFLINTARSALVNQSALVNALRDKRLAGVGMDILLTGSEIDQELTNMPNVMFLPHMASATLEARTEMGEKVILNIKMHEDGHRPPNMVFPS